jgi:hypothetical protein
MRDRHSLSLSRFRNCVNTGFDICDFVIPSSFGIRASSLAPCVDHEQEQE